MPHRISPQNRPSRAASKSTCAASGTRGARSHQSPGKNASFKGPARVHTPTRGTNYINFFGRVWTIAAQRFSSSPRPPLPRKSCYSCPRRASLRFARLKCARARSRPSIGLKLRESRGGCYREQRARAQPFHPKLFEVREPYLFSRPRDGV